MMDRNRFDWMLCCLWRKFRSSFILSCDCQTRTTERCLVRVCTCVCAYVCVRVLCGYVQARQNAVASLAASTSNSIDPEFLAALPPDIQADVIRQHQREEAAASAARQATEVLGCAWMYKHIVYETRVRVFTDISNQSRMSVL